MKGHKVSREVSQQEMLGLREEGYNNAEIAELLEISYSTVCSYIGRAPKELRKPWGSNRKEKPAAPETPKSAGILPCGTDQYFVASDKKKLAIRSGRTLDIYQMTEDGDRLIVAGLTVDQVGRWASELADAWRLMQHETVKQI